MSLDLAYFSGCYICYYLFAQILNQNTTNLIMDLTLYQNMHLNWIFPHQYSLLKMIYKIALKLYDVLHNIRYCELNGKENINIYINNNI